MMKNTLSILTIIQLLVTLTDSTVAQQYRPKNLVPNSSFEHLIHLPLQANRENYFECEPLSGYIPFQKNVAHWKTANLNTPDLRIYNGENYSCLKKRYDYAVRPKKGKVMVGIITHMSNYRSKTYREFISLKLKEVLKPGIKTYCELWVCKDRKAKLVSNNIGFYFSQRPVYSDSYENIAVRPQVNHHSIINKDGQYWEKISGYFYPEKPLIYLTIGNFYSNDSSSFELSPFHSANHRLQEYASYLIDEVRVWQENDTIELMPEVDLIKNKTVALKTIRFESNSAILLPESFPELNKLFVLLKTRKNIRIVIYGHTDNQGTHIDNQCLSERRAKAVLLYLDQKGIATKRMRSVGYGESRPIDKNTTASGRQNNRRVEFMVLDALN